jgi:hypothetical protein
MLPSTIPWIYVEAPSTPILSMSSPPATRLCRRPHASGTTVVPCRSDAAPHIVTDLSLAGGIDDL